MAKKEKTEFDGRIWPTILDFNVNIDTQLTSKANFLFGASTLILVFVINKMFGVEFWNVPILAKYAWLSLLAGSFISSLFSLMIVLPRIRLFSSKVRMQDDVLYYKNILKFFTRDSYHDCLKDLPTDNKRIAAAYSNQIYSLATYVIPYKFKLLKFSGWSLITSILVSLVLLGITFVG